MTGLDLRLVPPALAVWLVAGLGPVLTPRWLLVAGVASAVSAAVAVAAPDRLRPALVATASCAAAGCVVVWLHVQQLTTGPVADAAAAGSAVAVTATLIDDPRLARSSTHDRPLVVARVRVSELRWRGETFEVRVPVVVLSSAREWLGLLPSQRVQAEGLARAAERGADVAAVLSGRGPPLVLSPPSRVHDVAGTLRAGLRAAVAPLPAAERGLLPGLVVGDVSGLSREVEQDFRVAGLTHLVAVSGTNCSIVVGAVLLAARRLGLNRRLWPVLALAALVGFVVLARPSPSVLRAAVMGAIGLLALATGTRRAALPALATAVLVLLFVSPGLARQPGFALSVVATAALLVLAPAWMRLLSTRLPLWLAAAIAVPAAAQAACGPIVAAISGQVGLFSVPANLLAAPAVAPATLAGVVAALVAPLALPVAQGIAWLGWLPTAWLVLVARVTADLPAAAIPWADGVRGGLLLLAVTLGVVAAVRVPRWRLPTAAAALAVVGVLVAAATVFSPWPPRGWVAVACDVGQGDALVLAAGPGAAVVVDAGPEPAAVDRCLTRLGVRAVPLVVLTHLHADHAAGLPGVLRGRDVGMVEVGPGDEPHEQWVQVRRSLAAAGVGLRRAVVGERRQLGRLRWEVLAPHREFTGTRSDPNSNSVVLRVEVAGVTLLLSGDVEPEAQQAMVERGLDLRADVLKTPHHGSKYQHEPFLDAVAARVVVTSVGADNDYGHPAPETIGRLTERGAVSARTDWHGDVAVVVVDGRLGLVTQRGSPDGASNKDMGR